jgi:hypothetical protein
MKFILYFLIMVISCITILSFNVKQAQNYPPSGTTTSISSFPNTYFPKQQAKENAGSISDVIDGLIIGGAGAGGSAIINAHSGHSNFPVQANGGSGGTNWNDFTCSPQHAAEFLLVNGIKDEAQVTISEEVLELSPVSANMYSTITWTSTSNSQLNITLFNAAGHAVLIRQYPLRKGVNELLLTNLETLPAGIYFIKASDGASNRNGKLAIHK